jgi:hypothetical protein
MPLEQALTSEPGPLILPCHRSAVQYRRATRFALLSVTALLLFVSAAATAESYAPAPVIWRQTGAQTNAKGKADPFSACVEANEESIGNLTAKPGTVVVRTVSTGVQEDIFAESRHSCYVREPGATEDRSRYSLVAEWLCPLPNPGPNHGELTHSDVGICRLDDPDFVNGDKGCGPPATCQPNTGRPIAIGTGDKFLAETDYESSAPMPLALRRYYSSYRPAGDLLNRASVFNAQWRTSAFSVAGISSTNWRSSYDRALTVAARGDYVYALRPDGKRFVLRLLSGVWTADLDITDRLVRLPGTAVSLSSGWEYSNDEDVIESYDAAGRLMELRNRAGLTQTLACS